MGKIYFHRKKYLIKEKKYYNGAKIFFLRENIFYLENIYWLFEKKYYDSENVLILEKKKKIKMILKNFPKYYIELGIVVIWL